MNVATYSRYSTEKQSKTSTRDQFRRCGEIAADCELTISEHLIFGDEALSGTAKHNNKRKGYQALINAWDNGEIDVIIVDELSRLTRGPVQLAEIQQRIEDTGVRLITADGLDTAQPNWQLTLGLQGIVGQQSIRDTQHRIARGVIGRLEDGYMIAPPAFGFDYERELDERGDKKGTHWVKLEEQELLVEEMYSLRRQGVSCGAIAKLFNERGILPPGISRKNGSKHWRGPSIDRMLKNTIYRGVFTFHGSHAFRANARKKKIDPKIREFSRPELRIVDDETWYICNQGKFSRTGRGGGKHAFAGLVTCGTCDGILTVHTGGSSVTLYCAKCQQARRVSAMKPGKGGSLTVSGLSKVLHVAIEKLLSPDIRSAFNKRLEKRLCGDKEDENARLEIELDRANRACDRLVKMIRQFDDDDGRLKAEYEDANAKRKSLEEDVARLNSGKTSVDKNAIKKQLAINPSDLLPMLFDDSQPAEKVRALLSRIFEEVVFESKPERFVAIIRITFSPGVAAAVITDTCTIDTDAITMRFRLSIESQHPTVWKVDLLTEPLGKAPACAERP